jgi:L-asparaginase / beta-aspartyl-peptidase
MKVLVLVLIMLIPPTAWWMSKRPEPASAPVLADVVIAVHGGAGVIRRSDMPPQREHMVRESLEQALQAGYQILGDGGSALDAVVASVTLLEDSPLFNAGRGAVLTSEGTAELDASIMDGRTRDAGAVAAIRHIRNPIRLARLVMDESPHVMMVGEGAELFAQEFGMDLVPNAYFRTPERVRQLEHLRAAPTGSVPPGSSHHAFGTVGAVALDRDGNLAAATSTGGMMNKRFGRVGDSPIIGAGTYADNATCAVSATGHGEFFIRGAIAYDVAAMMRYGGRSLSEAAQAAIHEHLAGLGGTGGVIALDAKGGLAMPFNTEGMFRGFADREGRITVQVYGD